MIRERPGRGGPGRIPSRSKDTGPCPEPLPMYGHSSVPEAACFLPQLCPTHAIVETSRHSLFTSAVRSRRAAAVWLGSQVTSLQSVRAASSEKTPHVPHSACCVKIPRLPGKSGIQTYGDLRHPTNNTTKHSPRDATPLTPAMRRLVPLPPARRGRALALGISPLEKNLDLCFPKSGQFWAR